MARIIIRDLRSLGICPDARLWCKTHGIDWKGFVVNGIDSEELKKTGDNLSLISRLEAASRERERNGK